MNEHKGNEMTTLRNTRASILLVEDQKENIDLLRTILGNEYKLRVATNGIMATRSIMNQPPDLVLLDVGLPDMDGFEVCRWIKTAFPQLSIPVIFITAAISELDEERGLELGAVDYIHKPYKPAIVKNRVRNQLDLSRYRNYLQEEVAAQTEQIRETQKGLLTALALATEYRDQKTGAHILRTKILITLFLEVLRPFYPDDLSDEAVELIIEASLLHDIGKIGIPDSILLKNGPLTTEEYSVMKEHAKTGQELLNKALNQYPDNEFLKIAVQMAAYHHEHWDGSGYPYGLKGEEIPLPARIMAIVDVYESLTANRVYRQGMPPEKAREIIVEGDGRVMPDHFDPKILSLFSSHHQEFAKIASSIQAHV